MKAARAGGPPRQARRRIDPPAPVPPAQPNILLITLDTVRYDATGLPPEGTNRTPFLRQIAAKGIEFTHSFSTFDSTPESHFSMLTGFVSGWATQPYDLKEHSVPYQLARDGYATFGIAANGNLSQRFSQDLLGFKSFTCLGDVWQTMSPSEAASARKSVASRIRHYGVPANDFNQAKLYVSAEQVLRRFEKRVSTVKPPFFGFLNFLDAHDPYLPDPAQYDADKEEEAIRPKDFISDFRSRTLPPEVADPDAIPDAKRKELVKERLRVAGGRAWSTAFDLDSDAMRVYRKRYRAQIRELDAALRRIFDILAANHLLESTIVIITSDHGESFGEKQLITHSFGNEGDREATHRVPLVIVMPASYGIRNHSIPVQTSSADIAPTIYDLAGLDWSKLSEKALPGRFGRSLVPYFGATFPQTGRPRRMVDADGHPISEEEWKASRQKAEETLRALGYLN